MPTDIFDTLRLCVGPHNMFKTLRIFAAGDCVNCLCCGLFHAGSGFFRIFVLYELSIK